MNYVRRCTLEGERNPKNEWTYILIVKRCWRNTVFTNISRAFGNTYFDKTLRAQKVKVVPTGRIHYSLVLEDLVEASSRSKEGDHSLVLREDKS
jgi:hypothetical protein